ncbi:hypothetical protein ACFFJT_09340 [Dyella flava]|uniref:Uncharacterized protein n=1 Tax=Dyella flava TaxID=1920170 RepID=A0ABS2KAJ2_9GAMM|nr:hypothetical protein [Dyella flava]MBM7127797.1 hypothetical protein [Dyella flava]
MGSKVIIAVGVVCGLALSLQAVAQNAATPSTSFQNKPAETRYSTPLPKLAGMPTLPIAGTSTPDAWGKNPVQASDWKTSSPTSASLNRFTSPANIHLGLTPVSNADALHRLPFYLTAPYWLPRSRPFSANNDPNKAQPATHGALLNDMATLIRSSSSD